MGYWNQLARDAAKNGGVAQVPETSGSGGPADQAWAAYKAKRVGGTTVARPVAQSGPRPIQTHPGPPKPDLAGQASTVIGDLLAGRGPYTPEIQQGMRADAYEDFAGGLTGANKNTMNRASAQGNLYSASTGAEAAQNERAGRAALGGENRKIARTAAEANHAAKIQGLQAYQAQIAGERDERMANAKNAVEREGIKSQYDQAILTTQMQIDAQKDLAGRAAGAAGAAANRNREWDLEDRQTARDWFLEDRDYEEPWRLNGAGQNSGAF